MEEARLLFIRGDRSIAGQLLETIDWCPSWDFRPPCTRNLTQTLRLWQASILPARNISISSCQRENEGVNASGEVKLHTCRSWRNPPLLCVQRRKSNMEYWERVL